MLIAADELKKAFDRLHHLLKASPLLSELVSHEGQYQETIQQVRLGTLSFQDASLSKNKIRFALMEIARQLEEGLESNPAVAQAIEQNDPTGIRISIKNSKNINTGDVLTGGGDFKIGDN